MKKFEGSDENFVGYLKSGSITEGFVVRLLKNTHIEDKLRIGDFIVIEGRVYRFFGIVDDLRILSFTDDVFFDPPKSELQKLALEGSFLYSEAVLAPYIMYSKAFDTISQIKTIPEHFSKARLASGEDIEAIFKKGNKPFFVGMPLTKEIEVHIDLEKLCLRNNGIFGITGSGKTVLAKIIFSGIIKHDVSSLLIFDMHNEYGMSARDERGVTFKALKYLFRDRIKVFDVNRGNKDADSPIIIPYKFIEPEDLELLSSELSFSEKSLETAYIIERKKRDNWLKYLLNLQGETEEKVTQEADLLGVNASALLALVRHTSKLSKLDFLVDTEEENTIEEMLKYLKAHRSVIVQFTGKYQSNRLAYFLVSNVITRRIHSRYENMPEEELKENRVVIVIEEAHKFLSTSFKEKNIFGTIAREMRKFNVTLFVIDQRPSDIDTEVLSQVGTRFTLQLLDERDIDAVFQGVGGGNRLKKILRSLQPREVLVVGFSVPMPIALRVREYGEGFFDEMQVNKSGADDIKDIYG